MHLKVIACEVAAREVYHCAAESTNTLDIVLFTQGLHDNPDIMRERLQKAIDAQPAETFAAILLGYGLCNNGVVGLKAGHIPMVIPRAHDCITFFLGSKERYAEEFARQPGTYYYTSGWLEYPGRVGERVSYTPASGLAKRMALMEFIEKYGEENGRHLFESQSQWEVNYTHGAFVGFPFLAHLGFEERVREICREKDWEYVALAGDLTLVRDWLDGRWDDERFLIVQPGQEIVARYDDRIVACRNCPSADADGTG